MKEIIIKENYNVRDSFNPKGLVVMEDNNGNIVFRRENMILEKGRKLIASSVLKGKKINFTSLALGTDGSPSNPAMEAMRQEVGEIPLDETNVTSLDFPDIGLKVTTEIKGYSLLREIGLKSNDILFSRLVIDPVPLSSSLKYKLTYYIYF